MERQKTRDRTKRKIALVTGGSRGIGKAIALALATEGFQLVLGARTVQSGEKHEHGLHGKTSLPGSLEETITLCDEILGEKSCCFPIRMDLLNENDCVNAIKFIRQKFGRLDAFVNCAVYKGPGEMKTVKELKMEDFKDMIQCNVLTPTAMIKEALDLLLNSPHGQGRLIQISTSSTHMKPKLSIGNGGWDFAYVSTKAAMEKMIGILHVEHPELLVFAVEPGLVVTEIMKKKGLNESFTREYGSIPPEVCASVVAHLCSSTTKSNETINKMNGKSIYAPKFFKDSGLDSKI